MLSQLGIQTDQKAGTLTFDSTLGKGTRFTLGTNTCTGQTIPVGGTCTILLKFNGTGGFGGINPSAGVLSVPSNSPSSPTNLAISGS